MNGDGAIDHDMVNNSYDVEAKALQQTIEVLEEEKTSLVMENRKVREKVESLTEEFKVAHSTEEELRVKMEKEMEEFERNRRVLEEVTKRNEELETVLFKLQNDMSSAIDNQEVATAEVAKVRGLLSEAEARLADVEKEKTEIEKNVQDFKEAVRVLEGRETEEKSKRLRIEEEMKGKTEENDKRIKELEDKLEAAEGEIILLKNAKSSAQTVNGIDASNRDAGVNSSKIIAGSAGGVVLIAAAAATIILVSKSSKP